MTDNKKRISVLLILSMIAGLVYLTPFLRFSFYDQMKEALDLTDIQIGSIGFIYGLFNVIGYIPTGFIAEKFNTKRMFIISCAGMAATTLWYSTYPSFSAILVIHALYGVFSVWTFWSPYLKAIRCLAPDDKQSTIYGLSEGIRGIGQTIVSFCCLGALGVFAEITLGFRVVLWINAAAFIVLMILTIIFVPDLDAAQAPETAASDASQDAGQAINTAAAKNSRNAEPSTLDTLKKFPKLLRNPGTWICIAVIMCAYCLWNTINGYLGTYTTRVLNVPASVSSVLSIIRSYLIVFLAGFTGGILIDRFKARGQGLMLFFLCAGIGGAAAIFANRAAAVCILLTIFLAYVINVLKSTYWSILGDAGIPRHETGAATGIISLIGLTPDFFTSPVISRFVDYGERVGNVSLGFNMMFIWIIAWASAGIASCLVLTARTRKLRTPAVCGSEFLSGRSY